MKSIKRLITILIVIIMSLTLLMPITVFATDEISAEVTKGKTISMQGYMGDISGKTLIWSSSNPKIATVNASGVAKGIGVGQCVIAAKTKDGSFFASALLTVTPIYETGIKLSKSKVSLNKGKTASLKATLSPSNTDFKTITWDSDNPNIATVTSKGVVNAISTGTCTITATSTNGKTVTCIVTVLPQKVTSVKFGKTSSTYYVGQNAKIPLTVNPASADNREVNWTSSKPSVAVVDKDGNVVFLSGGKVTIKATAQDGSKKAASKTFTVKQYVSDIGLNATEISIAKGKTYTLKASVTPSTATNKAVTWSSNNTKVATVSSSGVVKGVAGGTVTITCKAKDGSGKTVQCTVNVIQPVTLPGSDSLKKGMTDAEYAQAYAVAEEITNKYKDKNIIDQLEGVVRDVNAIYMSGTHSEKDPHYNDVYGALVLRRASCAGVTRAVGLCLTILGIPYEHVNENKWQHQWCRVYVAEYNEYWVVDGQGNIIGPEPAPYQHPFI